MSKPTLLDPSNSQNSSPESERFSGIRKQIANNINVFNPKIAQEIQIADKKGSLNVQINPIIRAIVEEFVPTITTNQQSSQKKNLSRKQRKIQREKGNSSSKSEPVFSNALNKVQTQVFESAKLSRNEVHALLNATHSNDKNSSFVLKKNIRLLSELPIPGEVFEGVDHKILADYTAMYLANAETIKTHYNHVGDLIRLKIIPLVTSTINALHESAEDSSSKDNVYDRIKMRMNVAQEMKDIFLYATFSTQAPVHPLYVNRLFINELIKYNLIDDFSYSMNIPVDNWLTGIYAEAYGISCFSYLQKKWENKGISLYSIQHFQDVQTNMDLFAKSDAQYYIKSPTGEYIWSVDFKGKMNGDAKISLQDALGNKHPDILKSYLPQQLHSLPIQPIEMHIGVPGSYIGKLYTQHSFENEFEQYNKHFAPHIEKIILIDSPIQ